MAMKRSDDSEKQNQTNETNNTPESNLQEDLLKTIKALQDKQAELEKRLQSTVSDSSTTNNDFTKLAEAIKDLKKDADEIDYSAGVDESKIPADDILSKEDWVTFAVPKSGYPLTCDKRNGFTVKLPFNKKLIWFDCIHIGRSMVGKHTVLQPVATYTCKSKAERDWIRAHSLYGTLIFESTKQAMSTDVERAMRLTTVIGLLKDKPFADIVNESRDFGLPFIAENPELMRQNLAIAIVNREKDVEREKSERIAHEAFEMRQTLGRMQ